MLLPRPRYITRFPDTEPTIAPVPNSMMKNSTIPSGSNRQPPSVSFPLFGSTEDVAADEEMMQCIKRQQARKIANGAKKEELDDMLHFPDPIVPTPASTPACAFLFVISAHLLW